MIIHEGRVVLIRRGKEPLRGRWLVPGGTVELGETLEEAVVREVLEETGLTVTPREVILVFDRILRDEAGAVRYHYVIVDYVCDYVSGTLRAGTDAEDAVWAGQAEIAAYDVPEQALSLIERAWPGETA